MEKILQANPLADFNEHRLEILTAIEDVLNHGHYILGPHVEEFEASFALYIGTKHAIGVASGTDALHLALRALNIQNGDEVITVSHTAVATVAAIEQCGATPIFVDINPETYTIDPKLIEKAISPKTKVIIPVHLYGNPADLSLILDIAHKYHIFVVEDCAQAHGAIYKSKRVGGWGDIAAFSFYPTKNLGAIGDGGLIATNNDELFIRIMELREYGWKTRYISEISGFNSRLDEIQAAILNTKLLYLDKNNHKRHGIAEYYSKNIMNSKVIKPIESTDTYHVFHQYVIRHPRRAELIEYLQKNGVGSNIHYPVPVHLQPAYRDRHNGNYILPMTENVAKEIISLPIYPQLGDEKLKYICYLINRFE